MLIGFTSSTLPPASATILEAPASRAAAPSSGGGVEVETNDRMLVSQMENRGPPPGDSGDSKRTWKKHHGIQVNHGNNFGCQDFPEIAGDEIPYKTTTHFGGLKNSCFRSLLI